MAKKNQKIEVKGHEITVFNQQEQDFISLTDIAKHKSDDLSAVIGIWMRNRNTIEFLGIWESLYNPDIKPIEFEGYRKQAGLNAFTLSPKKWTETTHANVLQLVCLANLENLNAVLIQENMPQKERLLKFNHIAISQIKILLHHDNPNLLDNLKGEDDV